MPERFTRFLRLGPRQVSREVDDEIAFHLEMSEEDLIRDGLPPEEARARSVAAFGDDAPVRRECTQVQQEVADRARRMATRATWSADLTMAVRGLRRSIPFTVLMVLTLGLGIGATTTVYSVLRALLVTPLALPEGDRLALLFERRTAEGLDRDRFSFDGFGYPVLRDAQDSFDLTGTFTSDGATLRGPAEAERVALLRVTSSLFTLLNAAPIHGRLFSDADDRPGAPLAAILTHELWERTFAGDPAVVGRRITLDNREVPVAGILSPDFPSEALRLWAGEAQIFLNVSGVDSDGSVLPPEWGVHTVLARRRPNRSWEQAQIDMDRIARTMSAARLNPFDIEVAPLADEVAGSSRPALLTVLAAAGILLLTTCANAATLLLSRAVDRDRELALHAALGAGRGRLVRQAGLECLGIALLGATASLVVVLAAQAGLRALAPELGWIAERSAIGGWATIPWLADLEVDLRVLAVTAALGLMTSLMFGLAPAIRAARSDPLTMIQGERAPARLAGVGARITSRDVLTVAQVAFSFILLVGAGLLVQSFLAARAADLGFSPQNVVSLYVNPSGDAYRTREQAVGFYQEALQELEGLPGVESVGAVDGLPLTGGVGWTRVRSDGETPGASTDAERGVMTQMRHVAPGYFETLGIPVLSGRVFTEADRPDASPVVVVDELFANGMWPGESPLGKRVYAASRGCPTGQCLHGEVVGVVKSVQYQPWESGTLMTFYDVLPQAGDGGHGLYLVARSTTDAADLIQPARRALQGVDADQPAIDARTMEARLGDTLAVRRLASLALQSFAILALVMALVGLYGTVAYNVRRGARSIAIRIALGAQSGDVWGMVIRKTLYIASCGIVTGFAASIAVTRALEGILYGVSPTDPPTYLVLFFALLGVCGLAALKPARSAARVDPVEHLSAY